MALWLVLLGLSSALSFVAGYLVRRWHRPVGAGIAAPVDRSATTVMWAGGAPYESWTVRSRRPLRREDITATIAAIRARCGPGTP